LWKKSSENSRNFERKKSCGKSPEICEEEFKIVKESFCG
jgi:hypothetical protein